jgi:hypothetical protein
VLEANGGGVVREEAKLERREGMPYLSAHHRMPIGLKTRGGSMQWLAILLILLAGFYLAVERGTSTWDRALRWMVIAGAMLIALLIGSGART